MLGVPPRLPVNYWWASARWLPSWITLRSIQWNA